MAACFSASPLMLGIETSCDETAAAVVSGGREILSSVVASQDDLHARFGGVVPEVASRRHAETITAVVGEALARAGVSWPELGGIAVTVGPGLIGSLLVGVVAAKGYALATGLPLVGVNHVEAHLFANFLHKPGDSPVAEEVFPALALVVSGGHTDLILVRALGDYALIAWTRDDAAGEALDKAARVLGLGYPGGPAIDRASRQGNPEAVPFPRPLVPDSLDFSFSGLKTALIRIATNNDGHSVADLAASFQEAVVDTLVRNTAEAAVRYKVEQVLLAGGVAANSRLRQKMAAWGNASGIPVRVPSPGLCTDNGAMIAAAGYFAASRRGWDSLDVDVYSAMPVANHL